MIKCSGKYKGKKHRKTTKKSFIDSELIALKFPYYQIQWSSNKTAKDVPLACIYTKTSIHSFLGLCIWHGFLKHCFMF